MHCHRVAVCVRACVQNQLSIAQGEKTRESRHVAISKMCRKLGEVTFNSIFRKIIELNSAAKQTPIFTSVYYYWSRFVSNTLLQWFMASDERWVSDQELARDLETWKRCSQKGVCLLEKSPRNYKLSIDFFRQPFLQRCQIFRSKF